MPVKKLPLLTIPVSGGGSLTVWMSSREDAYQSLQRALDLVADLRSEAGPNLLQRQIHADQLVRMLKGESFDRVFGINRKALQGQQDPRRDYWLALEYWLLRRKRVPDYSALEAVNRAWGTGLATVKRLRTLGRAVCGEDIDLLLRDVPTADHRKLIDRRLAIVAEERERILGKRSQEKRAKRKAKTSRR